MTVTVLQHPFFDYTITLSSAEHTFRPLTVDPPFSGPGFLVPHLLFLYLFWSSISGPAFSVDPLDSQKFANDAVLQPGLC